jgi:diguanylate cyclase (GGDEF)-like protein
MEERSRHDPLTGLLNRRGLEQAVDRLNSDDKPFVAMLVDLDGFKAVNDTYGHRVGDELLKSIARRLEQEAPQGAALARVGGDEFVVLFPVRISAISVTDLASRIAKQHSLRESVQVGASIGIYETDNPKLTDIMLRADTALFAAKRRHRIERDLKTAIDSGNLATWFQPVIRLEDNAIVGFEALLRWDHPLYGAVPPPDIVTAAREQGLLQLVTEKVLLNCCTMIANLKAAGRRDVRVAMNLSPRELEVGSVDALILDRLQARGLPTDMLEIEITEEAPLDHERVGEKLGRLSEAGISIVLDDFGTGFSTLVSLKDGWIRKIKIDQTFVRDLANSIKDQALVRSIIDLGRALGREVMAEGVETDADRQILRSLGCETAQGYYFSKALPMKEALDLAPQQLPEGAGRGAVQNLAIRMSGE